MLKATQLPAVHPAAAARRGGIRVTSPSGPPPGAGRGLATWLQAAMPIVTIAGLAAAGVAFLLGHRVATSALALVALLASVWTATLSRRCRAQLLTMTRVLDSLSGGKGDLTQRLSGGHSLARSFNLFMDRIAQLVWLTTTASQTLTMAADKMAQSSSAVTDSFSQAALAISQTADSAGQQAATVSASAQDVETLSGASADAGLGARRVAEASAKGSEMAKTGLAEMREAQQTTVSVTDSVTRTTEVIGKLSQFSKDIESIVVTIKGLAAQTNLLSLNAAIEAARAGDHGRGFSVVAEEVRKLATQSAQSAQQITALVAQIQGLTTDSIATAATATASVQLSGAAMDRSVQAFASLFDTSNVVSLDSLAITGMIDSVTQGMERLSANMEEMAATAEESAAASEQVDASAQEQRASIEEINAMAYAVAAMAKDMQTMVDGYETTATIWGDHFVTHIAFVDGQHQGLFDLINRFGDAVKGGHGPGAVKQALQGLLSYTQEHFNDEEALMARYHYPELSQHAVMHANFVNKVHEMVTANDNGDIRAVFNASKAMVDWLQKHILEVDIKGYVPYVRERGGK